MVGCCGVVQLSVATVAPCAGGTRCWATSNNLRGGRYLRSRRGRAPGQCIAGSDY